MTLATGKLPPRLLKKLLVHKGAPDPRVVLGPQVGEDAAIVRVGRQLLVLKTDPVTYASSTIGWYAVHVNANDIATRGAKPAWFQAAVLLPEGSDEALAESIFKQISKAAKELGVAVTGGHTEVTPGIAQPIVVGDMHGVMDGGDPVRTSGARAGDALVLTKGAGIEGTALIARERRQRLLDSMTDKEVDRAADYLFKPGLSVVPEASLALRFDVHSMHDPTEGGVAMGVFELSEASGRRATVDLGSVPVLDETRKVCDAFRLDPLGLLGSGALLAAFAPADADKYVRAARGKRMRAVVIGKLGARRGRPMARSADGKVRPLSFSERDEVLKALEG